MRLRSRHLDHSTKSSIPVGCAPRTVCITAELMEKKPSKNYARPMSQLQRSDDHALADRLVNYSDALVTLAFLTSSGLGLAIADPDTRETLTDVALALFFGNATLGVIFTGLLIILRRWELDLRSDQQFSTRYLRYSRRIYIARHVVIWLSISQTLAIMLTIHF